MLLLSRAEDHACPRRHTCLFAYTVCPANQAPLVQQCARTVGGASLPLALNHQHLVDLVVRGDKDRILRKPAICAPAPGGDFRRVAGAPALCCIRSIVLLHKGLEPNNSQQASAEARPCPCFIRIMVRRRCVAFVAFGIRQSSNCSACRCSSKLSSATTAAPWGNGGGRGCAPSRAEPTHAIRNRTGLMRQRVRNRSTAGAYVATISYAPLLQYRTLL